MPFDPTDDDPPAPAEEVPAEYDETDYFNLIPETVDDATDEEFAKQQDRRIIADMVRSFYNCLGCAAPLPAWRGSWCDACVEWGE